MTVTLTDDEILASAAVLERDWQLPLPTVRADPDDVDEAVVRGLRALLARQLLSPDGGKLSLDPGLGELLGSADLSRLIISFYVTGGDVEPEPASPVTYVFPVAGREAVLRLTSLPGGLNSCERSTLATVRDQVGSLVRTRWGSATNPEMRMSFLRRDAQGLKSLDVRAGGAVTRSLVTQADGVVRDATDPSEVASVDAAVSIVVAWTS